MTGKVRCEDIQMGSYAVCSHMRKVVDLFARQFSQQSWLHTVQTVLYNDDVLSEGTISKNTESLDLYYKPNLSVPTSETVPSPPTPVPRQLYVSALCAAFATRLAARRK